MRAVTYRKVDVDGIGVFYREAGPKDAPTILLLHGFPPPATCFAISSRNSQTGFDSSPPTCRGLGNPTCRRGAPSSTHSKISRTSSRFAKVIGLDRFAIHVFDYGAPVGFRLAVRHSDRLTAIISQNGNAYEEGLSDGWKPIRTYWLEPRLR